MINNSEISIVMQGAVSELTVECARSVREILPGVEFILSTWKGSPPELLSRIDADIVLLNEDPGFLERRGNINRQIVSARNGLRVASRPYAMKTRTDIAFTGDGFKALFENYKRRTEDHVFFKERVVIPLCWNPRVFSRLAPGDFVAFGLREDVQSLWEIRLFPTEDEIQMFPDYMREKYEKYVVEDYLFLSFLNKTKHIFSWCDPGRSDEHYEMCVKILVNNFVCGNAVNFGIDFKKESLSFFTYVEDTRYSRTWYTVWHFMEWVEAYIKYCGASREGGDFLPEEYWKEGRDFVQHKNSLYYAREGGGGNQFYIVVDRLADAAEQALECGDYDGVVYACNMLLSIRPGNLKFLRLAFDALLNKGDYPGARNLLGAILSADPQYPDASQLREKVEARESGHASVR